MSGAGETVCEGWLRKSPPEKKLRRYAWKRRWFVLRSGRLSGEPDVLQYYKHQQARRPIRTINLNLCEQVDAGLSFTKKELQCSFVFDLRTEERTWYLVAESEEDMNRWVSSICLLCGFNPTEEVAEKPPVSAPSLVTTTTTATGHAPVTMVTGSGLPPYDSVSVQHLESSNTTEEDYLWLSHCQSHSRLPLGSSTSLETDYNDTLSALSAPQSTTSSSSSSPSSLANGLPPPSCSGSSTGSRTAPWTATAMAGPLSQSLESSKTLDVQKKAGRPSCHSSPHPRKHSLDIHLRPVVIPLGDDTLPNAHTQSDLHSNTHSISGYQIPRPASSIQPRPPCPPSSAASLESLTQAELHTSTSTPPPRPPKPPAIAAQGESLVLGTGLATLPRSTPELERRGGEMYHIPGSLSDRTSMFDFSESFNSYFFNKGLVPLGSVCSEDNDVDENYVPMSAATTEPPLAPRPSPPPPSMTSDPPVQLQDSNYVAMIPVPPCLPPQPNPNAPLSLTPGELASLGKQVPPPAHMGFRNSPLTPATPPLHRHPTSTVGGEAKAQPPPIHRNLKPQCKVKPVPLDITPVQDWQEVLPPVHSPVTRTFTRDRSSFPSVRPCSAQSSSPSSDSDDTDDNYVAMTTCSHSFSTEEPSLRLLLHRTSEAGVSSPLLRRARGDKQVEYLDLDLHTGRATPRQKRCATGGGASSEWQGGASEERARGERTRVDYVVVDPERTKALRNTREAWHDGRMSTEKEKC
ncbi:GRB2-associated-binding protein 1-like [Diretmus argenteus]